MANTVIFQSTDRGATKVFDNEGLVLEFYRQNNNLVEDASGNKVRLKKSDDWICTIEDTEDNKALIERAKKHRDFSKEPVEGKFWIVEKTPVNSEKASTTVHGTLKSKKSKEE